MTLMAVVKLLLKLVTVVAGRLIVDKITLTPIPSIPAAWHNYRES
jgi:hypothetical protein